MRRAASLPIVSFAAIATAIVSACITTQPLRPTITPSTRGIELPHEIRVRVAGRVRSVPLEQYVLGTALSEVSPVGEPPATVERIFEVQAILARTYAAAHVGRHGRDGFDLCDDIHCQLYEPERIGPSRFTAVAREAVQRTRGQILIYGNKPIEAVFHADCGGHTADASLVWSGPPLPYLVGGPDDLPAGAHRTWDSDVSADQIRGACNAGRSTAVGRRVTGVRVLDRDRSGRVLTVEVQGERVVRMRGEQFRALLNEAFGPRTLMSTRFTVARAGQTYTFTGSGYGHGVGLCQVGAATRARRGESLDEIFAAYFPGASLAQATEP
jgi:stage II sporulation protein D